MVAINIIGDIFAIQNFHIKCIKEDTSDNYRGDMLETVF